MEVGWDQMMAVALLTIAAAVGIGTVIVALRLMRALIRWVAGASGSHAVVVREPATSTTLLPHPVSASDLFAVRSNLDAVSRQLEDLENKLRRAPFPTALSKEPRGEHARLTREPLVAVRTSSSTISAAGRRTRRDGAGILPHADH
jgi:hypothetical protein